jgi:pSer/pThr/pTyr-binding forkhead associated (FHA) protein
MKLSLVVQTAGAMQGKVLDIKLSQFVIGRDPQCHLRPASALISKRHCAILQRDGKAFVRDFDSTNGTVVNDVPVKGEVELKNDDQLRIGPLTFVVRLEKTAAVPAKVAADKTTTATVAPTVAGSAKAPAKGPGAGSGKPTGDTTPDAPPLKAKGGSADDDIAAMLLSLQDDPTGSSSPSDSAVPDGSTQHEIVVPPEAAADGAEGGKDAPKKDDQLSKTKAAQASTSAAAKSILEKYLKRPRS